MNQKSIYDLSRIERYMMQMRPVLSKKALFSRWERARITAVLPNQGKMTK